MKIDVTAQKDNLVIPQTFLFSGVSCGIKKSGKKDLALIHSPDPCSAAGVYTTNLVHAASIDWDRAITPSENIRAVVINSGNANACTGQTGVRDNRSMAHQTADAIGCRAEQVLVLSTGVIGQPLPMEHIAKGIPTARASLSGQVDRFLDAAHAITTTDAFIKVSCREFSVAGTRYSIAGMAKGAGMIGPRMATMLGIVVTDFPIDSRSLDARLRAAVDRTFNCISVDGHMSTNDAVLALAARPGPDSEGAPNDEFAAAMTEVCGELARLIPIDGEGATHLIEIRVSGCESNDQADAIARCIAASPLVKTAITGNDPNWGRIVSAAGYAGPSFDSSRVRLSLNGYQVFSEGQPVEFDERRVSRSMVEQVEVIVDLNVGAGQGKAIHWTSDLTTEYVSFNSEYTT